MTRERAGAATVIAQEGGRIEVDYKGERLTVPMRGFPPSFKVHPGSRVILVDEPTGPVARPLVRAITSNQRREAVGRRLALRHEGRRLELQEGTIFDEPYAADEERASEEYDLWILERADGDSTEQVIAGRRRRKRRPASS